MVGFGFSLRSPPHGQPDAPSLIETMGTLEDPRVDRTRLRTFLELPHGIPSHDMLGRVFARLDAARFEECFRDWVQAAFALTGGQVVPGDGKCLRGSHDRGRGLEPLHLAGAWAEANRLVSVRTAVDSRSNEITAIPELLRMLCPGAAS